MRFAGVAVTSLSVAAHALVALSLLAAVATAAPPAPPKQQSATEPETVTIEAKRERATLERRVKRFVSGITRAPFQDSLAQWQKEIPICFAVAGLTHDHGEYTLLRLSQIAVAAGAPLASERCNPNFYAIATSVPDELIAAWSKHNPSMFGDASGMKVHRFLTMSTPIRAWYNAVLYNGDDGTPCTTSLIPGLEGIRQCHAGGHVRWGAVRDLSSVIVLIDTRRTKGMTFGQLAAYVAMVGLAEIRVDAKVDDAPTILGLFTDAAPPAGMSAWDTAYLKAMYHTEHDDPTQLLAIGQSMMKDIAP